MKFELSITVLFFLSLNCLSQEQVDTLSIKLFQPESVLSKPVYIGKEVKTILPTEITLYSEQDKEELKKTYEANPALYERKLYLNKVNQNKSNK